MTNRHVLVATGTVLGLSVVALAQNAERDIWGSSSPGDNPGDPIPGSLTDLEGQTGSNGHLGVQYLNGTYWSGARNQTGNHQIHAFDASGTLTRSIDQVSGALTSSWGYRDGASDGTFLYFGWEDGVARHNADGTGGVQIITGGAPGGVGTWRALAFDPDLDGGHGGLWVQHWGSALITARLDGTLIDDFGNASETNLFGLALADGRLFGHHTDGDIIEINRNDGTLIGTVFNVASSFTAYQAWGGLSEVPGGGFGSGNPWDLAVLGQGEPDEFAVFELTVPAPDALALFAIGGTLLTRRGRA